MFQLSNSNFPMPKTRLRKSSHEQSLHQKLRQKSHNPEAEGNPKSAPRSSPSSRKIKFTAVETSFFPRPQPPLFSVWRRAIRQFVWSGRPVSGVWNRAYKHTCVCRLLRHRGVSRDLHRRWPRPSNGLRWQIELGEQLRFSVGFEVWGLIYWWCEEIGGFPLNLKSHRIRDPNCITIASSIFAHFRSLTLRYV